MSVNQAHHPGSDGVVLYYGERLLIFYDGCHLKLGNPLKASSRGRAYLTSHRVIFIVNGSSSGLRSFSMPFVLMKDVSIEQPTFGANCITGKITAEANGGWSGTCTFKITFNKGGAIEFGKNLLELGRRACAAKPTFAPPPVPTYPENGAAQYYNCPPPAYTPPYQDPYYNFVQPHETFVVPPANSLYYVGAPPPYPGVAPTNPAWPPSTIPPSVPAYNQQGIPTDPTFNPPPNAYPPNTNNVQNAYYFNNDPHSIYAHPSAPPPSYFDQPAPAGNPPYPIPSGSVPPSASAPPEWESKKNQ